MHTVAIHSFFLNVNVNVNFYTTNGFGIKLLYYFFIMCLYNIKMYDKYGRPQGITII
jgi:hypothetical protein